MNPQVLNFGKGEKVEIGIVEKKLREVLYFLGSDEHLLCFALHNDSMRFSSNSVLP